MENRDIKKDREIIEMAKTDSTIQTDDIAEYYLNEYLRLKNILDKKELATIMSALIDATISRKYEISEEKYTCEEECKSLINQVNTLEKLSRKISKLIND